MFDTIFTNNFEIKKDESILILIDNNYIKYGKKLVLTAKKYTNNNVELIEIPEIKVNGEEPPKKAAQKMLEFDIIILLVKKSLSHTNARKNASKNGAKIASMPSFNEKMLTALKTDYKKANILTNKIADILDKAKEIRLIKDDKTDLHFSINNRLAHGRHSGLILNPRDFCNLPDGECYIAPLENTANGTYIIDTSVAGIGYIDAPIKVSVKNGFAQKIEGKESAKKLYNTLKQKGKKAFNIAEFGIGTNPQATIIGQMLQDEKVLGTTHIAFGNNTGFGGKTNIDLHIDCVISKPSFYADNKLIMKQGKFVI